MKFLNSCVLHLFVLSYYAMPFVSLDRSIVFKLLLGFPNSEA